jgi:hypothetical protein
MAFVTVSDDCTGVPSRQYIKTDATLEQFIRDLRAELSTIHPINGRFAWIRLFLTCTVEFASREEHSWSWGPSPYEFVNLENIDSDLNLLTNFWKESVKHFVWSGENTKTRVTVLLGQIKYPVPWELEQKPYQAKDLRRSARISAKKGQDGACLR